MMRFWLRFVGVVTLGCAVAVGLALMLGRVLPPEDEFLFTSTFDGNDLEIYRMTVQRHMIVAVTRNSFDEFQAAWSPDGEAIVFVSNRSGTSAIYQMDAQGKDARLLTEGRIGDYSPAWSPDGQWVAFVSDRHPRSRETLRAGTGDRAYTPLDG